MDAAHPSVVYHNLWGVLVNEFESIRHRRRRTQCNIGLCNVSGWNHMDDKNGASLGNMARRVYKRLK
jgi:hypothetical protein